MSKNEEKLSHQPLEPGFQSSLSSQKSIDLKKLLSKFGDPNLPEHFSLTKTTYYPHIKDKNLRTYILSLYRQRGKNKRFCQMYASVLNAIYTNKGSICFQLSRNKLSKLLINDKKLPEINSDISGLTYKRFIDWGLASKLLRIVYEPIIKNKDSKINFPGLFILSDLDEIALYSSYFGEKTVNNLVREADEYHTNYLNYLINYSPHPFSKTSKIEIKNNKTEHHYISSNENEEDQNYSFSDVIYYLKNKNHKPKDIL